MDEHVVAENDRNGVVAMGAQGIGEGVTRAAPCQRRGGVRRIATVGILATTLMASILTSEMPEAAAVPAPLFSESFGGTTIASPSNWVVGYTKPGSDTSTIPCMTAGTTASSQSLLVGTLSGCASSAIDASGSGALRLTAASADQSAYILYDQALTTASGLDITFQQAQYGGTGADGISFFLKNGANTNTSSGSRGGGLGYSLNNYQNTAGIRGGLFGIGFDKYGDYRLP